MLKRIIYLLMLVLVPMLSFGSTDVSALFKAGNGQYAKAHYKEAAVSYQQILDAGYQSAAVYFNLGNAYYKAGDIPSALLNYERAHKLSPGDEDIRFNIQLANSKTTDKIDEGTEFFITRWWHSFILSFSANALAVFTVLFIIAGSAAFVLYRFSNLVGIKKTSFYAGLALMILGLSTWLIANRQSHYFEAHHQAIVFSNSVTVKSEPAPASKTLFVIHDGTKVNITANNNGWIKVMLSNGNEGWISANDVKEI